MDVETNFPFPLYLVVSEQDCIHLPWLKVAEEAILGGVDIIQLREKKTDHREFLKKAMALKEITDHYQIPLVINDAVEIATSIDAWGVHVGQNDMPPSQIQERYGTRLNIGWSIESLLQLDSPEIKHVQHLGVSPVFRTKTKTDTITEWGILGIQQLRLLTALPLIAIGNINESNIAEVQLAGASSMAVVSAICHSTNPREVALVLKKKIKNNLL
ncbi:thiamine-phosphate pyrophosphorylase [Sphingobacterium nematocida]|uniref:Thiamine-phosphate synthase n=1 Tax=Sphingobacterium nematocida TaxID=1513896 RepID=A0A1T5B3E1_9SPHI|nr:thiamine phosphate synthase [Sphingobacterium nematocida]SKB41619.1 thiamine-phosphate pyrophosphorylase [Sphingobacterium nematocida]